MTESENAAADQLLQGQWPEDDETVIYVQRLLEHPAYQKLQKDIAALEADRIYCLHTFSHSMDVCRIAWILFLQDAAGTEAAAKQGQTLQEDRLQAWKERIYLAGLLHDAGRAAQYRTGEHHGAAGRRIAERLLEEIGCPAGWREEILFVVALHFGRDQGKMRPGSLGDYVCRADHLSRNCFLCDASDTCKWTEEEKNKSIVV